MKRAIQCVVLFAMTAAVNVALADRRGRIGSNGARLQGIGSGERVQVTGENDGRLSGPSDRGADERDVRVNGCQPSGTRAPAPDDLENDTGAFDMFDAIVVDLVRRTR